MCFVPCLDDRISLFHLNPHNLASPEKKVGHVSQTKHLQLILPVSDLLNRTNTAVGDLPRLSHVVSKLTPDAFYQVSVQAVTKENVTGYPAVISSSPRVLSRPPTEAPSQVGSEYCIATKRSVLLYLLFL